MRRAGSKVIRQRREWNHVECLTFAERQQLLRRFNLWQVCSMPLSRIRQRTMWLILAPLTCTSTRGLQTIRHRARQRVNISGTAGVSDRQRESKLNQL